MNLHQGDLLVMAASGEFDIIVHGCNCFNTMSAGLAKQIKKRYPSAYVADMATTHGNINKLGSYTISDVTTDNGQKLSIVNAYTQFDFNRSHQAPIDRFEYESFRVILGNLAKIYGDKRFGFPLIGTGLAGGDLVLIMDILSDFEEKIITTGGSCIVVIL